MVFNRKKLTQIPSVFRTLDSVDGSVEFYSGGAEWCVGSAGFSQDRFVDGVSFAPDLKGGLLCIAELGKTCITARVKVGDDFTFVKKAKVKSPLPNVIPIVHYGNTMVKDMRFHAFLHTISQDSFATTKSVGSTTLELVKVACGDIDGFVHTLNDVDSVAPGVVPLQLSGAQFEFFCWNESGELEFFSQPSLKCIRASHMGVCAGNPEMFPRLKAALIDNWQVQASKVFFAKAGSR